MSLPLVLAALLFAVLATIEWGRLPIVARVYLGVGTAFAIGALAQSGMGELLAVARMAGFAAVTVSVATALRSAALR